MSNKKSGTTFEREFCKLAAEKGFWATMLYPGPEGQPADIILAKNNIAVLVDCKDCKNNRFPLSRIEENQELSMKKWLETGNENVLFALKTSEGIYIFYFTFVQKMIAAHISYLNLSQITSYGIPFNEWVERII